MFRPSAIHQSTAHTFDYHFHDDANLSLIEVVISSAATTTTAASIIFIPIPVSVPPFALQILVPIWSHDPFS